jgi:hypothetical protein
LIADYGFGVFDHIVVDVELIAYEVDIEGDAN